MSISLQEQAESRFFNADHLELRQIRCTFQHAVLTLRGSVSSFKVRQAALEMIKDLKGIEVIDNQIIVNDKGLDALPS
jgi:hypothetical protein